MTITGIIFEISAVHVSRSELSHSLCVKLKASIELNVHKVDQLSQVHTATDNILRTFCTFLVLLFQRVTATANLDENLDARARISAYTE